MTADAAPPSARGITGFDLFLSVVVVFNLAIARPLLDLLGQNPEFFIAHDWSGLDVVLLALLLTVAVPAVLGAIAWVASRISRVGSWVHHVLFGTLCALLAIQALEVVGLATQGTVAVLLALTIGALVSFAFRRSGPFRSFLRMGAFVPFLVVAFFLFGSRASDHISPTNVASAEQSPATDPAPIVVIVMDELPLASLMDGTGHIDGDLFPNFARVAEDFTWFRDTTTVHNLTPQALPALLDGRYPKRGALPTVDEHPANLFTLLSDQYELLVLEQITDLCPESVCRDLRPPVSFATRWTAAIEDLRIVLGHILLPADLAASLPPIDETWQGFGGRTLQESFDAQVADFEVFMGALQHDDSSPQLYFLHLMLPHPPWRFLPSGQQYPETAPPLAGFSVREDGTKVWTEEAWPVAQAYQRHLLQVGFTDLLLGRLFERFRAMGVYDEALIVVAADHGAAFRPGLWKRFVAPETLGELAAVPLFVKRPGQSSGEVDDRPAQIIDILPTIQDVIGQSPVGGIDGSSLFAPPSGEVVRRITTPRAELEIGDVFDDARSTARVKYAMFDLDGGITGLFGLAPPGTESMIGTRVESWDRSAPFAGAARIADPSLYDDIDAEGETVPAMIAGSITATSDAVGWPVRIAVAVEGRISAVTQTFGRTGDSADFYALVPPEAFVDGRNVIELFVVEGRGSSASLAPIDVEGS